MAVVRSVGKRKIPVEETAMQIDRFSFKKIFFHLDKLYEYLTTGDTYPIRLLTGFTDYCNHNCIWCYSAYSTHDDIIVLEDGTRQHKRKKREERVIDSDVLLRFLGEARAKGLRSVSIVGSGEPLLHPQSGEMMVEIGKMGLDFGVFSNGQKMADGHFEAIVQYATFFRFSLDAADSETHKRLHGPGANFDQVIANMKRLIAERNARGRSLPTIGAQFIVSQFNAEGMISFTRQMRDIGIDYVVFKPMYENPINTNRAKNTMTQAEALEKLEGVKQYETKRFTVYDKGGEQFRNVLTHQQFNGASYYQRCMSHQFLPSLHANGNIYICPELGGRKEFVIGNIYENTLDEIWQSDRRKRAVAEIDLHHKCPARCHLDPLNKIIWDITHPDPEIHPNFL